MCVRQGCLLSMLLYNIATEVLANLINADKRIKGIEIGDYDIKTVNLADNNTIFFRDITCLNRIQVILKPYENKCKNKPAQKIVFSESQGFMGWCV